MIGEETETAWVPDWYPAVQFCELVHWQVMPWEVEDIPLYWRHRIMWASKAEAQAQEIKAKHS